MKYIAGTVKKQDEVSKLLQEKKHGVVRELTNDPLGTQVIHIASYLEDELIGLDVEMRSVGQEGASMIEVTNILHGPNEQELAKVVCTWVGEVCIIEEGEDKFPIFMMHPYMVMIPPPELLNLDEYNQNESQCASCLDVCGIWEGFDDWAYSRCVATDCQVCNVHLII